MYGELKYEGTSVWGIEVWVEYGELKYGWCMGN